MISISQGGTPVRQPLPEEILALRHASCGIHPESRKLHFYVSAVVMTADNQAAGTVWKSVDLGATWQQCIHGPETCNPSDPPAFSQVSTCPCDARRVWLISEKYPELDAGGERVVRHGILSSIDSGTTWEWAVKMDDDHDPSNRSGGWAERDYGANWGDLKGDDQISPKGRFAWDVVASPVDPRCVLYHGLLDHFRHPERGWHMAAIGYGHAPGWLGLLARH